MSIAIRLELTSYTPFGYTLASERVGRLASDCGARGEEKASPEFPSSLSWRRLEVQRTYLCR